MTPAEIRYLQYAYTLPPTQARLLAALLELDLADHEAIAKATGHVTPARIEILRLRRKVEHQDIKIFTRHSGGFFLDNPTKMRIIKEMKTAVTFQSNLSEGNNHEHTVTRSSNNQKTVQL